MNCFAGGVCREVFVQLMRGCCECVGFVDILYGRLDGSRMLYLVGVGVLEVRFVLVVGWDCGYKDVLLGAGLC